MEPGDRWQKIARARGPRGEACAEEGGKEGEENCRNKAKAEMKGKSPKAQLERRTNNGAFPFV
jgi:hypothetical protein